jgi:hypothetical protein
VEQFKAFSRVGLGILAVMDYNSAIETEIKFFIDWDG